MLVKLQSRCKQQSTGSAVVTKAGPFTHKRQVQSIMKLLAYTLQILFGIPSLGLSAAVFLAV